MKHDWEYKKLGEVASYINGYAFKPEQWTAEGVPIIRIQNLNNQDAPFNFFNGDVPDKVKVKDGDLLISWSASLGAYIWRGCNAFLNQHIFKVDFDKSDINKYFLKYAVSSKLESMGGLVHGATMKHIVKKDFDNTKIPYPPLSIQEQIVSELDKVSEIIEKKKQQVKELDNLAQSIFYDMFGDPVENEKGWEVKKLDGLCDGIGDGLHGTPNYDPVGDVAFINGNNLVDGKIVLNEKTQFVSQSEAEKIFIKLNTNTVLVSINGTLGKTAIYNNENVVLGKSACYCRLKDDLMATFVRQLMDTKAFASYLEDNSSKSTIKNVGLKAIRNYLMILPPLSLQQSFAQKIEVIEKQKEIINQSIKEAQLLFDARMDYYFGE